LLPQHRAGIGTPPRWAGDEECLKKRDEEGRTGTGNETEGTPTGGTSGTGSTAGQTVTTTTGATGTGTGTTRGTPRPKSFHGSIQINPSSAKMRLVDVADEIISLLAGDPNASLNITLEINAEFPNGASDQIKRAVTENATSLGFKTKSWE
jgi:hypothetical protein